MKPILYESTKTQFNDNGIGILSDAVSCFVTEERNGRFELVLNYPVDGIHYAEIKRRSIIAAKAHADGNIQPFRVYRITKPLNGMVSIYAEHISYDLSGIAVSPFDAGSAAAALQGIKTNSVIENPFEFWTDKSTVAQMNIKTPVSARAVLGGVAGSVLDTYGGEYEWDGYTVKLHNERGQNRGVSIRYGKNLVDLEQEENCAAVYTAVMPFWADSEGNTTMLTEKIVRVSGTFDFERVLTLDLSNEFDAQPTQEELRNRAQKYIADNNIGVPKVSLVVSFVPLEQTEEYKDKAFLEKVLLCDTVNVIFEKLGVFATAKVVKTVFDVLLNRYKTVELGDAQSTIADTIAKQDQAIKEAPKKAMSMVAQAAENATQLITGNRGGYVVIHSSTGQSQPDEILIMDKPTIEEAVKVWRWNNSGLGYSETGYSGTYTTAWTIDGAFNADFITAGTISANLIKSGLLLSHNGITSVDMDDGKIRIELESGVRMEFSGEGFSFKESQTGRYLGGINAFFNPVAGVGLRPNSTMNVYDVYDNTSQRVLGKFWNTGDTDSQLDVGRLFLRKGDDMDTDYAEFYIRNDAGCLYLNGNDEFPWLRNFVDEKGYSICEIYDAQKNGLGVQYGVAGGSGQISVWSDGIVKGGFLASSAGAELRIGGGDSSYNMAWNYGDGSHLQADHHHFLGKSDGLFTLIGYASTSSANPDEYSAFLVVGKPYSEARQSSIIIPANTTGNYQIADEEHWLDISYSGTSIQKGTGAGSTGSIVAIYGIR